MGRFRVYSIRERTQSITERGRPAHVLLTFEEYQRLAGTKGSIVERLGLPRGIEDVELEIPPLRDPARPADLR